MLDILEENKDYKVYRLDYLTEGSNLKFEHSVYCEDVGISSFIAQGEEKIQAMRQDSMDGEKKAFDIVLAAAKQWEQQAAVTQKLNRALEYLHTPEVKHTANEWRKTDNWRTARSVFTGSWPSTVYPGRSSPYTVKWRSYCLGICGGDFLEQMGIGFLPSFQVL